MRREKSNGISSTFLYFSTPSSRCSSRVFQHRAVEDVFQAGLEMADEIGVAQHFVAFVFEDVAMEFQDDVVNRQRAGLVGAEHVHRAEVLDGIEPLDDDFFLGHRQRALGQADGNDHRQHFRREADGHGEREEKRFFPVVLGECR